MTQALDMSSLLVQAVDKTQSEMTKVLRVRTEQTVRLGLADLLSYFTLDCLFVNECEEISGHPGLTPKGVVNNQIQDFILLLHEVEKQKLVQNMEYEKWERIDFIPQDVLTLAHIVQSMTTDPWLGYTDVSIAAMKTDQRNLQTNCTPAEPTSAAQQDKKDPTLAVIEEENFMLTDSAATALRGIEQYTILLASIPGMANEISTALLDYLKLYNSRTQQLILGAGAKITAGLTNINTKHLALAVAVLLHCSDTLLARVRPASTIHHSLQHGRIRPAEALISRSSVLYPRQAHRHDEFSRDPLHLADGEDQVGRQR